MFIYSTSGHNFVVMVPTKSMFFNGPTNCFYHIRDFQNSKRPSKKKNESKSLITICFYQFKRCFQRKTLVHLYKTYVQPILQYGVLVYACANKTDIKQLDWAQNHIIRIIFGLKKYESVREVKDRFKLLTVTELHTYELLKILVKILRNEVQSECFNSFLSKDEIESFLKGKKRIKELKTLSSQNKHNKKKIKTRIRSLFNFFVKMDHSFLKNLTEILPNEVATKLHNIRDNYIQGNIHISQLFW